MLRTVSAGFSAHSDDRICLICMIRVIWTNTLISVHSNHSVFYLHDLHDSYGLGRDFCFHSNVMILFDLV